LSEATGEALYTSYKYQDVPSFATEGGIAESNGRVYLHLHFPDPIFLIYNTTTLNFDYSFSEQGSMYTVYDLKITENDFIVIVGQEPSDAYTLVSKSFYSNFFASGVIQNSTFSMTDFSSGMYVVTDRSSGGFLNYHAMANGGYDNGYAYNLYVGTSGTIRNFYDPSIWNLDHFEPNLLPNKRYEVEFTWTWYKPGEVQTISYSLVGIDGGSVPSWASLDLENRKVILNPTPNVAVKSKYNFGFQATFGAETIIKKIYLTVGPNIIENWKISSSSSNKCNEWEIGYQLSEDKTECSNEAETESIVVEAIVATGVAISLCTAMLSMSSPQSIFSMINQFQMFILLPMIGAYIPPRVIQIFLGMNFSMFSFSFIPLENTPLIGDLFNFIDYDQNDDYFDTIGLTSGSAFLNSLTLMLVFGLFALYHLSLLPCYHSSKQLNEKNWFRIIVRIAFNMMTFSFYVIFVLETYLVMCLSTVSELNAFDHSTSFKTFSLWFAFVFTLVLLLALIIAIHQNIKAYPVHDLKRQWYFRELFGGLKNNTSSRLFKLLFMVFRVWFVLIVIVISNLPVMVKSIIFSLVQLTSWVFTIISRPFENAKDSIIEINNQLIFLIAAGLLIHFDTKPEWSTTIINIYVYLIMIGPWICTLISFIFLCITIFKKLKKWSKKPSSITSKPYSVSFKPHLNSSSISIQPITKSKFHLISRRTSSGNEVRGKEAVFFKIF
jgi:hypothetical protein